MYSHPVFETVEAGIARLSPAIAARPLAARLVLRSLYVVLTVVAAILLPFISDLMGMVGLFQSWLPTSAALLTSGSPQYDARSTLDSAWKATPCLHTSMRPSTVQTSVRLLNGIWCRQVGAYGFTPMTFILPSFLWLVVRSLLYLRVILDRSINYAAMKRHD